MRFPRGLEGYRDLLSAFPNDLMATLLPWVQRLHSALGAPHLTDTAAGMPNGYDGIASKGSYERLLISEWMWADAEPLEFLRRAAAHEQMYFRQAFENPRAGRRVLAILDSGPHQLGAPRLCHLALLLVLAERAHGQGAELEWGVLHKPGVLHRGATPERITQVLGERTLTLPSDNLFDAWLAKTGDANNEVWWIGSAPSKASLSIGVRDTAQTLLVDVVTRGRSTRHLTLPVPAASVCRRLLSNPFYVPQPNAVSAAFSRTASRTLFRQGSGEVAAFSVQNTTSAPITFQPMSDEYPLAADYARGTLTVFCIARDNHELRIWRGHSPQPWKTHAIASLPAPFVAPERGSPLLPCALYGKRDMHALLLDAEGKLFDLGKEPKLIASNVGAMAGSNNVTLALRSMFGASGVVHPRLERYAPELTTVGIDLPYQVRAAGFLGPGATPSDWTFALDNGTDAKGSTTWLVGGYRVEGAVVLSPGEKALGVGFLQAPGVFVAHENCLFLATAANRTQVLTTSHPIQAVVSTAARKLLLVQLGGNGTILFDYEAGSVVRRWGDCG